MSERVRGTIQTLALDRGFGFVRVEGKRPIFFHMRAVVGAPFEQLKYGQPVEVELEPAASAPKGPRARSVKVLTGDTR